MTVEPERPDLLAYALFDLDPRARGLQRPLQTFLISLTLYELDGPATRAEIKEGCEQHFLSDDKLAQGDVGATVAAAVQAGLLEKLDGGLVKLTDQRREQLAQAASRIAEQRAQFHSIVRDAVARELGEDLTDGDFAKLKAGLEGYIQRLFQERSIRLARNFGPDGNGFDDDTAAMVTPASLSSMAKTIVPASEKLRIAQISAGIEKGLLAQTEAGQKYLAAIYQRTVASALLRQDPSIRRVRSELARRRTFYLDTNVVMAFLFEAHSDHDRVRTGVDAALSLGCTLSVSPYTLEELETQLKESDQVMKRLGERGQLLEVVDDVILRTFAARRLKSPGLDWRAFYAEHMPPADALSELDIRLNETDAARAHHDERRDAVENAVRRSKPPQSHSKVIEYDTDNLILVQLRRAQIHADEMGSRVWLVTLDRNLRSAEKVLVEGGVFRVPSSKRLAHWTSDLSPLLSPDAPDLADYALHLVQSQLGLIAEDPIFADVDFLETLNESQFDLDSLLDGGPQKARRVLVALQEDREIKTVLGSRPSEPAEQEAWAIELRELVEKALEKLDIADESQAALEQAETERDHALRDARQSQRERDETRRIAAEEKRKLEGERDSSLEKARELEQAKPAPRWWSKLRKRLFDRSQNGESDP